MVDPMRAAFLATSVTSNVIVVIVVRLIPPRRFRRRVGFGRSICPIFSEVVVTFGSVAVSGVVEWRLFRNFRPPWIAAFDLDADLTQRLWLKALGSLDEK